MAVASKMYPDWVTLTECKTLVHPWTDSCIRSFLHLYVHSCIGAGGYFAVFYLFRYIVRAIKQKKQVQVKDEVKAYVRTSLLCASLVSSGTLGLSCLFRNLLGRYHYYSVVMLPAMIAACSIFFEMPRNRDVFSATFGNLVFDMWIKNFQVTNKVKWTPNRQTLVFMSLTSILSYLFNKSSNLNHFWFYAPPKAEPDPDRRRRCFHKGSCKRQITKTLFRYFSTGFLLRFLGLTFANISTPIKILTLILKLRTYKLGTFLGLYAFIYQCSRCLFYGRAKKHSPLHDAIAGFIAGSTFRFEPNNSIFTSAIVTIIQILTQMGRQTNILPNLPYRELAFILSTGLLFHSRFAYPSCCPPLMVHLISTLPGKEVDNILDNYYNLISEREGLSH